MSIPYITIITSKYFIIGISFQETIVLRSNETFCCIQSPSVSSFSYLRFEIKYCKRLRNKRKLSTIYNSSSFQ